MAESQTILTTLKSKINFPLSEESYNTALIDAGLDGNAPYTKDLKKEVELCAAELILVVCTSGNVTEGGYSLTLNDKASLRITRLIYLNRWGMPDLDPDKAEPTIYDGSWLW
jgi:hypothetical protein